MTDFSEDRVRLCPFLSVISSFRWSEFLKLCSFTSVVKRYVCGEKEEIVLDGKGKRLDGEDRIFAREAEGFFNLFPELGLPRFPQFQCKFREANGNGAC